MPPTKRKCCGGSIPPKVLSNLPENIIDDILMRLPLRDAVRTSILSKNWRYNWCRLPELKLDQTLWETTNDMQSFTIRFTDIMYHLLALHVGPITKFTLSIANLGACPKFDSLICFLSRNGIEHLVLQLPNGSPYKVFLRVRMGNLYKLPSSFFTCSQMMHLTLHNCSVHPPPAFRGFNKLVNLELCEVAISSEVLERLTSGSPLLEQLVLQNLGISDPIQIKGSKLRSFEFTGDLNSISLEKLPLLLKLQLLDTEESNPDGEGGEYDLATYFESFPALEHLHLNYCTIQFLATAGSGDIPANLSSPLNCLKCLCLSMICLDKLAELSYALCLIRSSPFLQDIQIQVCEDFDTFSPGYDDTEIHENFSDVTLNHLRVVKLEGIVGTKIEMEFIKLPLAKSPMLERMLVEPGIGIPERILQVITVITKFRRASPKAEVDYKVDGDSV